MDVFRVPESLRDRPISELGLSQRCINTLLRGGIRTLGDLHGRAPVDLLDIHNFGKTSLVELQETMTQLETDESASAAPPLVSTTRDLSQIADVPLAELELNSRVQAILEEATLRTVGDFLGYGVQRAWEELDLSSEDLVNLDRELIQCEFWERGARPPQEPARVMLLSDREFSSDEPPNLLRLLPELAREIAEQLWSVRTYDVLRRRYGLEGSDVYKLAEIGSYYDFSRERARQLEARLLDALRSVLTGHHEELSVMAPEPVIDEFQELSERIQSSLPLVFPTAAARSLLSDRYGEPAEVLSERSGSLTLLLELLGLERIPNSKLPYASDSETMWMSPEAEFDVGLLDDLMRFVHNELADSVMPISRFKLTVTLNRNRQEHVSPELVDLVVNLLPNVLAADAERVELKFSALRSYADQAFRILKEGGNPLHFREIGREINRRHALSGERPPISSYYRSLAGQLSGDDRFVPIGRSGMWALTAWEDVRTEPIADLIQELLASRQEPLDPAEITEQLRQHRPGLKRGTVISLVGLYDDRFMRVDKGKVALVAWGLEPSDDYKKHLSSEEVFETLQSITLQVVGQRNSNTVPYADLVAALRDEGELPDSTARMRLQRAEWAEIHGPTQSQKVTIDVQAIAAAEPKGRSAPLTESIQELIREYLQQQENRRTPLASVCEHVLSRSDVKRPTIYRAVDQMEDVAKEDVDGTRYCFLAGSE